MYHSTWRFMVHYGCWLLDASRKYNSNWRECDWGWPGSNTWTIRCWKQDKSEFMTIKKHLTDTKTESVACKKTRHHRHRAGLIRKASNYKSNRFQIVGVVPILTDIREVVTHSILSSSHQYNWHVSGIQQFMFSNNFVGSRFKVFRTCM